MGRISMIAAIDRNRIIGQDQKIPWHLPADLKYFKKMTLGKPIIMGRRTLEAIGKPLPGRHNIVLTHNTDFSCEGVTVAHSIDDALVKAYVDSPDEIMIVGGATLYEAMLPLANRLYITHVSTVTQGDTRFPDWREQDHWEMVSCEHYPADAANPYNYSFITYERGNPKQGKKT